MLVGLGEALFDCFADHQQLGGAPVNVVVHANALLASHGGKAFPATRVGEDSLGARYLDELRRRGIDHAAVQVDPEATTGRVLVEVDSQGAASYEFQSAVAWDRLELTPGWQDLATRCHAVTFGTLAQRSAPSRAVITSFLSLATQAVKLFDVNLRGDFYDADLLRRSLLLSNAVKLNEYELQPVSDLVGIRTRSEATEWIVRELIDQFELSWVAVTYGSQGTHLYEGTERYRTAPADRLCYPQVAEADSVGAGDACCAALLVGSMLGWPWPKAVRVADAAGAFVASRPGATPELPSEILQLANETLP